MSMNLTHYERILMHLLDNGSITSLEAIKEYGNTRLSATIFELRKRGYDIKSETEYSRNRYDQPVHYTRYKLVERER